LMEPKPSPTKVGEGFFIVSTSPTRGRP